MNRPTRQAEVKAHWSYQDGGDGQRGGGGARPGDAVHPGEHQAERQGVHQGGEHRVPHPVLALQLLEETAGHQAAEQAAHGVDHDECSEQSAASSGLEYSEQDAEKQDEESAEDLRAGSDERRQQADPLRSPEHVAVDHLPARLLLR